MLHGLSNPFGGPFSTRYWEDPLYLYYSNNLRQMLTLCVGVKLSCALELRESAGNRVVVRTDPYHLRGVRFTGEPYRSSWGLGVVFAIAEKIRVSHSISVLRLRKPIRVV